MLAVDDVQFLAGKKATLIEFQNTIESLIRDGKQIILSAGCSLPELKCFDSELINRIAGGLPCAVQYPDETSRKNIITRHLEERNLTLPSGHAGYLAKFLNNDVRHIFGALNRLQAARLSDMNLDSLDQVHSLLSDLIQASRRSLTIRQIEKAVSRYCGIEIKDMRSGSRNQSISTARMLAMHLSRQLTGTAFAEIGIHFGGRSHSTVISADKKIKNWLARNHCISINHTRCDVGEVLNQIRSNLN